MQRIVPQIQPGWPSQAVVNLQEALCVTARKCHSTSEGVLPDDWLSRLDQANESSGRHFGGNTVEFLNAVLEEVPEAPAEFVDERVAKALNRVLEELGEVEPETVIPPRYVVSGQVRRDDGTSLADGQVRAFHETAQGRIRLAGDTSDSSGDYTISDDLLPGVGSIQLRVAPANSSFPEMTANL